MIFVALNKDRLFEDGDFAAKSSQSCAESGLRL